MEKSLSVTLAILMIFFIGCAEKPKGDPEAEKAAQPAKNAAQSWLALVDSAQYEETWDQAAEYFRNQISADEWVQKLRGVREPLGKLVSRKVKSAQFFTTLPGAPDGKYVVIVYETSFENKKTAFETVTPMLEKDGDWRVSGYIIQ